MRRITLLAVAVLIAVSGGILQGGSTASPMSGGEPWTLTQTIHSNFRGYGALAVPLPDGRALIVGGGGVSNWFDFYDTSRTAEIFDPETNSWSDAASMTEQRNHGTATVLQDGRVLVAGGHNGYHGGGSLITSSEVYSPATDSWSSPAPMVSGRSGHTATLLQDGRVLVASGCSFVLEWKWDSYCFPTAEVYDPGTDSWTATGPMALGRQGAVAARLPDGRVIVAGGIRRQTLNNWAVIFEASAEIYDPLTNSWTPAPPLPAARYGATVSTLADGRILVAGGVSQSANNQSGLLASTQIFDAQSASWSPGPMLNTGRFQATATTLSDGRIVVAGGTYCPGRSGCFQSTASPAEIIDPMAAGSWEETAPMHVNHVGSAARLSGNRVLVIGGHFERNEVLNMTHALVIDPAQVWGSYGGLISLSASLFKDGAGLEGKTVSFELNGITVGTAQTDANGLATLVDAPLAGIDPAYYANGVTARFDGDIDAPALTGKSDLEVTAATPTVSWTPDTLDFTSGMTEAELIAALSTGISTSISGTITVAITAPRQACLTFQPTDSLRYVAVTTCVDFTVTAQSYWSATSHPALETTLNLGTGCTCGPPFAARAVGAVVDPVHNLVYINDATGDQNRVAVIDGSTNQLVAHIPLQFGQSVGQANLIAVDPARNRLYVTDRTTPAIWTIAADTRTVLAVTPSSHDVGNEDFFIVNPATGLLYLGVQPNVRVLDPNNPANPLADLFMPGGRGHHGGTVGLGRIALDSVANRLYIATTGNNGIHVIGTDPADAATFNQVFTTLQVGDSLVAINPLTSRLYALSLQTMTIRMLDANPAGNSFGQVLSTVALDVPLAGVAPTVTADNGGDLVTYVESLSPTGFALNPTTDVLYARYFGLSPYDTGGFYSTTGAVLALNGSDLSPASMTLVPSTEPAGTNNPGRIAVNPATGRIYMTEGAETAFMKILVDRPPATPSVPTGATAVTVEEPQAALTFASVESPGAATIQLVDAAQLNLQSSGQFSLADSLAYEISTTAGVSAPIQLCFNASHVNDATTFATLTVLHGESGAWVDRTSSRDFDNRTICATVSSLSPFAIARRTVADTIAPTTTAVSSSAGAWSSTDVSVLLSSADDAGGTGVRSITYALTGAQSGSGIINGSVGSVLVTATGETTVTYLATDNAGNIEASKTFGVRIDRTAPIIAISSPSAGPYIVGQTIATSYTCSDTQSGVGLCQGPVPDGESITATAVGAQSFIVSATDEAGNSVSRTVDYQVAFGVKVLFDQAKPHRAGSTIPIKLQLMNAAGSNVSSAATSLQAIQLALVASTSASAPEDAGQANPDWNFRFDSSLGGYVYNLRTDGLVSGTYQLTFLAAGDPTVHTVQFTIGR